MNTASESRAERVLVWDLPVRIFHWLMVACFAGAWLTAESEAWRLMHVTLGYTMAGLVAFRIVWGLVGTRYARFADFVKGPSAVLAYVKSIFAGRPQHFTGHNPAGAVAIVALLALTLVVVATGYANYNEMGGEWLEEAHEAAANLMLGIVFVHLAGVAIGSLVHRENLVRAMITGRKDGAASDGLSSPRRGWALALLAMVAGVWWFQSQQGPLDAPATAAPERGEAHEHDD
jgi:cytochrome b